MNSVKDLAAVIGLHGRLRKAEGLRVDVTEDDARKAYGRVDYRVTLLSGEGGAGVTSRHPELGSDA
jgi:hypothetical protein